MTNAFLIIFCCPRDLRSGLANNQGTTIKMYSSFQCGIRALILHGQRRARLCGDGMKKVILRPVVNQGYIRDKIPLTNFLLPLTTFFLNAGRRTCTFVIRLHQETWNKAGIYFKPLCYAKRILSQAVVMPAM